MVQFLLLPICQGNARDKGSPSGPGVGEFFTWSCLGGRGCSKSKYLLMQRRIGRHNGSNRVEYFAVKLSNLF